MSGLSAPQKPNLSNMTKLKLLDSLLQEVVALLPLVFLVSDKYHCYLLAPLRVAWISLGRQILVSSKERSLFLLLVPGFQDETREGWGWECGNSWEK